MDLIQTRTIAAAPDKVWAALLDPALLQACIPGCETFERTGENEYRASVAAKIGPVSARFNGRMHMTDVDPPTGYTLKFEGQGGAAGFANGSARVTLAPAEAGQTALSYTVKAQVGGKLAQIGNRLVDGAAAKLADDFFARFAAKVEPPAVEAAPVVEAAPLEAGEPAPRIRWVRWIAIGVMVAIVVWLYWQSTGRVPR
jgi:carbon monoxide dehydrogenase subunit G